MMPNLVPGDYVVNYCIVGNERRIYLKGELVELIHYVRGFKFAKIDVDEDYRFDGDKSVNMDVRDVRLGQERTCNVPRYFESLSECEIRKKLNEELGEADGW